MEPDRYELTDPWRDNIDLGLGRAKVNRSAIFAIRLMPATDGAEDCMVMITLQTGATFFIDCATSEEGQEVYHDLTSSDTGWVPIGEWPHRPE